MSALYDVYLQARTLNDANPKLSRAEIIAAIKVPDGFGYDLDRVVRTAIHGPALNQKELIAELRRGEESAPRPAVMESLAAPRRRSRMIGKTKRGT